MKNEAHDMSSEDKLLLTKMRIQQWIDRFGEEGTYLAFSGGRDSTVLAHIIDSMGYNIPLVFNNTGLEYPEIKAFVKKFGDRVTWLKPRMSYQEVVKKFGFALVSKENSQKIYEIRNTKSDKLRDIRINGYPNTGYGKIPSKWLFLKDAPFEISSKCCDVLKKSPAKIYERKTKRVPITGEMMAESSLRRTTQSKKSCNTYDGNRPKSTPLKYWDLDDIKWYIDKYDVEISKIYDLGYEQTGCAWCAFGMFHPQELKNAESKFQMMKRTHPSIYKYSLDKMGLRKPIEYICKELGIDVNKII